MMRLLHRPADIRKSAQTLIAEGKVANLAVAYWGIGAIETLGIDGSKPLRILCNLLSGGCNHLEIAKFLEAPLIANVKVRHCDRLHSKVYLSPDRVLVGSANASTNGLWDEGSNYQGTIEAMIETDVSALRGDAQDWFDQLWDDCKQDALDETLLQRTRAAYYARGRRPLKPDALALLLENPAYFSRRVWLTYYESDVSDEANVAAESQKEKWHSDHGGAGFGDELMYTEGDEGDLTEDDLRKLTVSLDESEIYEIVSLTYFTRAKGSNGLLIWLKPVKNSRILGARLSKKDIRLLCKLLGSASEEEILRMNAREGARGYFEVSKKGEKDFAVQLEDLSNEILRKIRLSSRPAGSAKKS